MAYYFNQGALTNNLYPAPNNALNNANNWSNFANQCGYSNYNGMQGCLPLQNNYNYPPGFGYIPFGSATSASSFTPSLPFGSLGGGNGTETNVSYTRNADGSVSYTSSSGQAQPSTGAYIAGISGIIASGMQGYFGSQVAQQQAKTQELMMQHRMNAEQRVSDRQWALTERSMNASDTQNTMVTMALLKKISKDFDQDA